MLVDLIQRSRLWAAAAVLVLCVLTQAGHADDVGARRPDQARSANAVVDQERQPLGPMVNPQAGVGQADRGGSSTGLGGWVRVLGALGVVIGLVLLGKAVLVRLGVGLTNASVGSAGSAGAVEVVSRTRVGTRQQVLLVRVGQRLLVVGQSGDSLNTLAEVRDPEEVADLLEQAVRAPANSGLGRRFSRLLQRSEQAYETAAETAAASDRKGQA